MSLISEAKCFAIGAHSAIGHIRKYTGEPYPQHLREVSRWIEKEAELKYASDQAVIAAAWLHDTVEDTKVNLEAIEMLFGSEVRYMVESLTDTETGNRKERKAAALIRLSNADGRVQTIKYADLISNSVSIITYDPSFAKVFMKEMEDLVKAMDKGCNVLRTACFRVIQDYERRMK